MFLGMYQNNDSLSLLSVSLILLYFIDGLDTDWSLKSCIGLGIAISIGLLSYYFMYGWILMTVILCVVSVLRSERIKGQEKGWFIAKRAALIAGICFLLAGWFFIRNAILHTGDFLGITRPMTE